MKLKEVKQLLISAVRGYISREEAEYFANEIVETDIRKQPQKYSEEIIEDIKSWKNKTKDVEKTIDLLGYTQYNFNGLGPSLKIKEIHDELERKAKENGISMISIINSGGMHTMHLWTQGLAKRGMFAIGAWNGGPDAVVPFNGTRGIFGTNPLTYGFPGDKGDIVVDMATSEIPFFKIVEAKKNNKSLPKNVAVDSKGEITTDPNQSLDEKEVANLLPIGAGHKGYNINYLIEIMTSALIGSKISSEMSDAYIETEHGGFIIAIAIDKVTDRKKYDTSVKIINEEVRAQKPKNGIDKVVVPGDRNLEKKLNVNDNTETEVNISENYKKILINLAE
jgi:ureidoglycolate dehydrogenase (NAD+)